MKFLYLGVFGLVGVFLRFFIGEVFSKFFSHPFPVSTFLINILGSFVIGCAFVLGVEKNILAPELRLGLMVGLLGGFTTFSAYSLETVLLFKGSELRIAAAYFVLSPLVGLAATFMGLYFTRQILNGGLS